MKESKKFGIALVVAAGIALLAQRISTPFVPLWVDISLLAVAGACLVVAAVIAASG